MSSASTDAIATLLEVEVVDRRDRASTASGRRGPRRAPRPARAPCPGRHPGRTRRRARSAPACRPSRATKAVVNPLPRKWLASPVTTTTDGAWVGNVSKSRAIAVGDANEAGLLELGERVDARRVGLVVDVDAPRRRGGRRVVVSVPECGHEPIGELVRTRCRASWRRCRRCRARPAAPARACRCRAATRPRATPHPAPRRPRRAGPGRSPSRRRRRRPARRPPRPTRRRAERRRRTARRRRRTRASCAFSCASCLFVSRRSAFSCRTLRDVGVEPVDDLLVDDRRAHENAEAESEEHGNERDEVEPKVDHGEPGKPRRISPESLRVRTSR